MLKKVAAGKYPSLQLLDVNHSQDLFGGERSDVKLLSHANMHTVEYLGLAHNLLDVGHNLKSRSDILDVSDLACLLLI